MNYLFLIVFSTFLVPSSLARDIENIKLRTYEPVRISIFENMTDFNIGFDSKFSCPVGIKCEISVEIRRMNCNLQYGVDPDPTLIYFKPLKALGYTDEFLQTVEREWACQIFENSEGKVLKYLTNFDLTSLLIQPIGAKWELGTAEVELYVRITESIERYLDSSVQDVQLEISNSLEQEIKLAICKDEDEVCPYTIFTILESMECKRGNSNSLKMVTFDKNRKEIQAIEICRTFYVPTEIFEFDPNVASILITPVGKWDGTDVKALFTSTVHFVPKSGESCPSDYFSCGTCIGKKADEQDVISCIPTKFLCNKQANCGIPCYADESNAICHGRDTGNSSCSDPFIERYTNIQHELYIFLVKLFFSGTAFALILTLLIGLLFSHKIDKLGKSLRRSGIHDQYGALQAYPPSYNISAKSGKGLN